MRATTSA
ncbi:hypothetical protein YPPY66_2018, partial [Yersinia pestis PY-66]